MAEISKKYYEVFLLFSPELLDKQKEEAKKFYEDTVLSVKGEIVSSEFWEKRLLAYNIGGFDEGFYLLSYVNIDPAQIDTMEADLLLDKRILRFMISSVTEGYVYQEIQVDMKKVMNETKRVESKPAAKKSPAKTESKSEAKPEEKTVEVENDKTLEDKIKDLDQKLDEIVSNPDNIKI